MIPFKVNLTVLNLNSTMSNQPATITVGKDINASNLAT